jgi:Methane oxygenase PmoA
VRSLSGLACLLWLAVPAAAGDQTVALDVKENSVEVSIGGQPFASYRFGKELPKPFFSPVRGPQGVVLTRPIIAKGQGDHPHQKGLWISVDEVNEVDFWAEQGQIETVSVKALQPRGNPAKLQVVNRWLDPSGQPIVRETTVFSIFANRLLACDITFTALDEQVTFEDTKEGLFGFRMVDALREREGGKVVNSGGAQGTKDAWGQAADWVDYHGTVDGQHVGVALFDHPDNFRPSRYHVRDYGLFSINPFGERAYTNGKQEAAPAEIDPGESLRLRYGLYIHPGDTETGKVAETWEQFVNATKGS